MRSSTLASTPSSTPNFRSTLPGTLLSYFLGFPVSLFCSRPPGSQPLKLFSFGQCYIGLIAALQKIMSKSVGDPPPPPLRKPLRWQISRHTAMPANICKSLHLPLTIWCCLCCSTALTSQRMQMLHKTASKHCIRELSDPRNRNHKSLAIGNHNFEVASFSRRNRSKIAVSQSQKSHWAKKIAAIRNHTLVVATYSGGVSRPMWRFWNTIRTTQNWRFPSPKSWLHGVFSESQWFFWVAIAVASDLWFRSRCDSGSLS